MRDKKELQDNPIAYLYYFVSDKRLALIKKYFGSKAASTISQKRANQSKMLIHYYGDWKTRDEKAPSELSQYMVEIYGLTPEQILSKLMLGETVAGKNWAKGVYGIGKTKSTTFKGTNYAVDTETGMLYDTSKSDLAHGYKYWVSSEASDIQKLYANDSNNNTYISGYTYKIGDQTYTTIKQGDSYYCETNGTKSGVFNAEGQAISSSDMSSVWTSLISFFPKFIEWLFSIFGNGSIMTAENTQPSQSEFITSGSGSGSSDSGSYSIASVGIIAAGLIGGMLLLGGSKGKKKKRR